MLTGNLIRKCMAQPLFKIEMLPAFEGDAIWIEYKKSGRPLRRVLIDGGPIEAYSSLENKLKELPDGDKRVELVVITHIDTDHIEGVMRTLATNRNNWLLEPEDIWFNGWKHLDTDKILGGREGDFLSAILLHRNPAPWNKAFMGKSVVISTDEPVIKTLQDGMKITILAPYPEDLQALSVKWKTDIESFNLSAGDMDKAWEQLIDPAKYKKLKGVLGGGISTEEKLKKQLSVDESISNRSSIAFLSEFEGKSCLFLGDAHKDVICKSIRKLIPPGKSKLKVDAVKVSHHGSRGNISIEFLKLIDAKHFLFSSSGKKHKHPHKPTIEAVIQCSNNPNLWFNYQSKYTMLWEKAPAGVKNKFKSFYPKKGKQGIVVEL
jgi:hypothetical protein